jgi:hypothetical protein
MNLPNEKPPTPISADHKTMCKFSDAESQKFRPVWMAIKELVESSLRVSVPQPLICTSGNKPRFTRIVTKIYPSSHPTGGRVLTMFPYIRIRVPSDTESKAGTRNSRVVLAA